MRQAIRLLGSRSPAEIAQYLVDIEDLDGARDFTHAAAAGQGVGSLFNKPYTHTGVVLGFITPASSRLLEVQGISQVTADDTIKNSRIKITLDKFFVASYPGMGAHTILCEFSGKNQVPGDVEELTFAIRCQANDGSAAAIVSAPIFMGLTVGEDGISFKGKTINVKSNIDDAILDTFDSPAFKNGLALLNTAQPALKPLTSLATASVNAIISRKKNVEVHAFDIGLDFGKGSTSTRLRYGSYVVVQTNQAHWNWSDYEWNSDAMSLQRKDNPSVPFEFNYMIFGVTEFSKANS